MLLPGKLEANERSKAGRWMALATGLVCMLFALFFQGLNGAWQADLAGDPDEAAHAVTSLMVRDYLTDAAPENPLRYAQEYYTHFPKVALGHYPPGYYLVASLVLLPNPQIIALLALQVVFCGMLGWQIFLLGNRLVGTFGAGLAAVAFVSLPMVQKVASCVMSDLLLAICCLAAVQAWLAYLHHPSAWKALMFGLMASAAILTKGAGLLLALVPPISIVLTWEWRLLKKGSFWLAPLPVMFLAVPWLYYSIRFTQEGMADDSGLAYALKALPFYAKGLSQVFGPVIAVLLALGLVRAVYDFLRRRPLLPEASVLWALILGTLAVAILVPAGLSTRYLVPAAGGALVLAFAECCFWVRCLRPPASQRDEAPGVGLGGVAVMACVLGITFVIIGAHTPKVASGFGALVSEARGDAHSSAKREIWLVSSDARGEGGVVAAAAFGLPSRKDWPLSVLRASKELSTSDWMGRGYETNFKTADALRQRLDELHVDCVFADESVPASHLQEHHGKIVEVLSQSEDWKLTETVEVDRGQGQKGEMKLFRRASVPKTPVVQAPNQPS